MASPVAPDWSLDSPGFAVWSVGVDGLDSAAATPASDDRGPPARVAARCRQLDPTLRPTTDRWFAPLSDLKTRGDRVDLHVSREDPLLVPVADGQGAAARQRGPAPDRLHPGGFPEVSDGESALEEFREIVRRAGR